MKMFKKVISTIMASVIMVTALCSSVSADEFSSAKLVNSGSKISFKIKYNDYFASGKGRGESKPYTYKVELSENGTLKLDITSATSSIFVQLLDSEGSEFIDYDKMTSHTGVAQHHHKGYAWIHWEKSISKSKTTLEYKLKKGTYFVRVLGSSNSEVADKTTVSFTYPQTKSDNEEAKLSHFALSLNEGDSIQLDTVISGSSDSSVKWSSSKSSVASVSSKGKVTAKKKGSAVITAKLGSSSIKIKINVK